MSTWNIEKIGKLPKIKQPIFIEGLPGIGNVGKIAIDFIIGELDAKKIYEITSHTFPHSVFVNEENLVEMPLIEMFHKKLPNGQDILLLSGDVQPVDEVSSYEFSELILDLVQDLGSKEIITMGGIGLQELPKDPKVYVTGNSSKMIKKYSTRNVKNNLYGVVGPIVGASGLLVGLSQKRNIQALCFLAETLGHPMYLGIKSSKALVTILNSKIGMKLNPAKLDKEIIKVEKEMKKRTEGLQDYYKQNKKLKGPNDKVNYIG